MPRAGTSAASRRSAPSKPAAEPGVAGPALAVFAVALVLRLLHVLALRDSPYFDVLLGDARAYDAWAQRIASGDWLGTGVFYQAPLYPYVLGVVYSAVGRDLLAVRVVQAVFGAASAACLVAAGRAFFGRPAGIAAGLLLACWAPAIFFDGLLQKATLDGLLLCASLALLGRTARGAQAPRDWAFVGVGLGALALTRENALVLAAVVTWWALAPTARRPDPARLRMAGALLGGVAVVVAPVAIRNTVVGGEFHLTTAQFGPNFYIGNNPKSDGTYVPLREGRGAAEYEQADATALAEAAQGRALSPGEVSRHWSGRAVAYITSQPGDWLQLLGRKARLLLNAGEMFDTESQEAYAGWSPVLRRLGPVTHLGLLVPLALLGAVSAWPRRHEVWVLYALALAYAATVVAFYVFARYRYPLVPLLMLFAGAAIARAAAWWPDRATAPGPWRWPALAAAALAAVVANWPLLSPSLMLAMSEHNLGAALQEAGRLREAEAVYTRVVALRPEDAPSYNNLGAVRMALGNPEGAHAAFSEALRRRPEAANVRRNLANASYDLGSGALERGDFASAERWLREAVTTDPAHARAWNNLGIALAQSGRAGDAAGAFRRALAADPRLADAAANLARVEGRAR